MNDIQVVLGRWQLDGTQVRRHMYRAPTPRERERWHAIWLLEHGWSVGQVAKELERDARVVAAWVDDLWQHGPAGLAFEQSGGSPPP